MEDGTYCKHMVEFFVLCMWSVQSEFIVLFMVCNLWINPGFIYLFFCFL